jgi:hypothetical protein
VDQPALQIKDYSSAFIAGMSLYSFANYMFLDSTEAEVVRLTSDNVIDRMKKEYKVSSVGLRIVCGVKYGKYVK